VRPYAYNWKKFSWSDRGRCIYFHVRTLNLISKKG